MTKHTPTPWYYLSDYERIYNTSDWTTESVCIAEIIRTLNFKANATHILKCVNAHDDLVDALQRWLFNIEELAKLEGYEPLIKQTKQALEKAGIE